jgi:hypothetical protein
MDPFVDLLEEVFHLLDGETRLGRAVLTVRWPSSVGLVPLGQAELHLYGHAEALKVDMWPPESNSSAGPCRWARRARRGGRG